MINVLLLYPKMLFYKIPIFNGLSSYLYKRGFNLIVWAQEIEIKTCPVEFTSLEEQTFSFKSYREVLKKHEISIVVNILFRSNPGYLFYLYSIFYAKYVNKKVVFYGHGVNLESNRKIDHTIINLMHLLFDRLILYTPREVNYLWKINRNKVSVAYNTLYFNNRLRNIERNESQIKTKYKIAFDKIVLFSGRIQSRKKLEVTIDFFISNNEQLSNTGLIIIGSGLSDHLKNKINSVNNIIYLGPIYDPEIMAEIFYMSDIYTIPGHIGLGIVEAFYWGLPVITMNVKHAPEVYYLKNAENGFIVEDEVEYKKRMLELLNDENLLEKMGHTARETYENEANIIKMYEGFLHGINF